jgi:hypothetical protein
MLLEKFDVVPTMTEGGKDGSRPFCGGQVHVLLYLDAVLRFKFCAEHGVREADCDTD